MQSVIKELEGLKIIRPEGLDESYRKRLAAAERYYRALADLLDPAGMALLEQWETAKDDVFCCDASHSFQEGFRLGSLLMLEILSSSITETGA
jgi:hypothetical protein